MPVHLINAAKHTHNVPNPNPRTRMNSSGDIEQPLKKNAQNHQTAARVPGLLRFFPERVTRFPFDAVAWNSVSKQRTNRIRQRQRSNNTSQGSAIQKESVLLSNTILSQSVVVVFVFDPYQAHSLKIRKQLVELCSAFDTDIVCLAITSDDITSSSESFLQATGFCTCPFTPSLQTILNITHVPSLVVLCNGKKIPTSVHEELALEWNNDDFEKILQAWKQGQSALSMCQQLQASLMFPSCTIS